MSGSLDVPGFTPRLRGVDTIVRVNPTEPKAASARASGASRSEGGLNDFAPESGAKFWSAFACYCGLKQLIVVVILKFDWLVWRSAKKKSRA